jgi:menaquinone-dependent protoporphyrinogen IX oxidase
VFDVHDANVDPAQYDFLVLGSSVMYYKLTIRQWIKKHLVGIKHKPLILFTVSGEPASSKLDSWVADSLPENLSTLIKHVALRGKLDLKKMPWWIRFILKVGAWRNKDPEAKKEELKGFDFMDKSSINPITKLVQQFQSQAQ